MRQSLSSYLYDNMANSELLGGRKLVDGAHHLSVFIDDEYSAKLSLQLDFNEVFRGLERWDGRLFAGFTASTGRLYAESAITDWEVYEAEAPLGDYVAKQYANY